MHRLIIINIYCVICSEVTSDVWIETSNAWVDMKDVFYAYHDDPSEKVEYLLGQGKGS